MIENAWEFLLAALVGLSCGSLLWRFGKKRFGLVLIGFAAFLLLVSLYFFRDPQRQVPIKPGLIVAPADGKVVSVMDSVAVPWEGGLKKRISIYLSLFDVHINRIPIEGKVVFKTRLKGGNYPAFSEMAPLKNNAVVLGIQSEIGILYIKQMTGMMARRIVCRPVQGDSVQLGERYGLIKLGSRVDCFLPLEVGITIKPGDRLKAGESIIGCYGL